MTHELKRAIIKLKDRISESVEFKDDPNTASWGREIGILITRNEANLIVCELERPLPTNEEIEAYALEYILDGVGIQSMINTKAWIAGATWMRDLIRDKSEREGRAK